MGENIDSKRPNKENVNKILSETEQQELKENIIKLLIDKELPSLATQRPDNLSEFFEEMFRVVDFSKHPSFAQIDKVSGGTSGKIKPFFDSFLENLRLVFPLIPENPHLDAASQSLQKLLEAYLMVLVNKNRVLRPFFKDCSEKDYMLGNFAVRLMKVLQARQLFTNTDELTLINRLMESGISNRNGLSHADEVKSFENFRERVRSVFSYILGVNVASNYIYNARNGGVRFHASEDMEGLLQLYIDGEELFKKAWTVKWLDKYNYKPVYQLNFRKEVAQDTPCKLVFTPRKGEAVEYPIAVRPGEFVEIRPNEPAKPAKTGTSVEIIGVRSAFNVNQIKARPCKFGTFTGMQTEEGLPDGYGCFCFEKNGFNYTGTFKKGNPDGTFEVENAEKTFHFKGLLDPHTLSFIEGKLVSKEKRDGETLEKVYEGCFEGFHCKKGKYFRNGVLLYDGSFEIVDTINGQVLVYQGYGTMYSPEEGSRYVGEIQLKKPHGEGWKEYDDPTRPLESGYWKNGVLVAVYPVDGAPTPDEVEQNTSSVVSENPQTHHPEASVSIPEAHPESIQVAEENSEPLEDEDSALVIVCVVNKTFPEVEFLSEGNSLPLIDQALYLQPGQEVTLSVNGDMSEAEKADVEATIRFVATEITEAAMTVWDLDEAYRSLSEQVATDTLCDWDGDLPDGSYYTGQVDAWTRPQGKGKRIDRNQTYEGTFINGVMEGKGRWIARNGNIYDGPFVHGLKEGIFQVVRDGKKTREEYRLNEFIKNV